MGFGVDPDQIHTTNLQQLLRAEVSPVDLEHGSQLEGLVPEANGSLDGSVVTNVHFILYFHN